MRLSPRMTVIIHDLFMIGLAWELSWLARFNFEIPDQVYIQANLLTLPLVILIQGAVAWNFTLYKGLWRFASVPDLWNIMRAVIIGTSLILVCQFLFFRLESIPRSVFVLYPLFVIVLLGGPRLIYRLWKDHSLNLNSIKGGPKVLVIGAGTSGESLVRDMKRTGDFQPIGFIDDSKELLHRHIHGIPVLGTIDEIETLCVKIQPDFLLIAIPSANDSEMRRIIEICEQTGIRIQTLPKASELGSNQAYVNDIKDVDIEDLLGRARVNLNWVQIGDGLTGKTVLVTGGGGSIGAELCRQIAKMGPEKLIIFENSEFNLYKTHQELLSVSPQLKLVALLGSITDPIAVNDAMETHKPQLVFHAAAFKHVPLLQYQIRQAVNNNILGTQIVANAADSHNCERFVLISTDKAVNPSSIMGMCKRVAEIYCSSLNERSKTRYITVRFGNVLGSAGSVVPLFRRQILAGGPVTITHPEITRYFMTIPEASQLIMQAAVMGTGGEIFVLEMGNPVKITYLAEQMIRLMGFEVHKDIEIIFTGLRPGEKLYEELFHENENLTPTDQEKLLTAQHRNTGWQFISEKLLHLSQLCDESTDVDLVNLLHELVPEYHQEINSDDHSNVVALK